MGARVFTVGTSCHGMGRIKVSDLTAEECALLRSIVTDNWSNSPNYRLGSAAHAFLQGFEPPRNETDGWCLVEFWSHDDGKIRAFVDHVNAVFARGRTVA